MIGWVYIITNQSMPGIVKVGYSMQDPAQRASQLANTGNPGNYVVAYDNLVENPYDVEQATHTRLAPLCVGREWFRCTPEEAIVAIRSNVRGPSIHERFFTANAEAARDLTAQAVGVLRERIRQEKRALAKDQIASIMKVMDEERKKLEIERNREIWNRDKRNIITIFFVKLPPLTIITEKYARLAAEVEKRDQLCIQCRGSLKVYRIRTMLIAKNEQQRANGERIFLSAGDLMRFCPNVEDIENQRYTTKISASRTVQIFEICPTCKSEVRNWWA